MGGSLSVTHAETHTTRMKNDVVIPLKPIFYRRFVDDMINRRKKYVPNELIFKLNNYHRNIKLTIELSPTKFLDTQLVNLKGKIKLKVYRNQINYPFLSHQTCLRVTREMQLMVIYFVQSELQQISNS